MYLLNPVRSEILQMVYYSLFQTRTAKCRMQYRYRMHRPEQGEVQPLNRVPYQSAVRGSPNPNVCKPEVNVLGLVAFMHKHAGLHADACWQQQAAAGEA